MSLNSISRSTTLLACTPERTGDMFSRRRSMTSQPTSATGRRPRAYILEPLEERVLLSADPLGLALFCGADGAREHDDLHTPALVEEEILPSVEASCDCNADAADSEADLERVDPFRSDSSIRVLFYEGERNEDAEVAASDPNESFERQELPTEDSPRLGSTDFLGEHRARGPPPSATSSTLSSAPDEVSPRESSDGNSAAPLPAEIPGDSLARAPPPSDTSFHLTPARALVAEAGLIVGSSQSLGGTGTVAGSLIVHGILSPGNSPGTIHITGDLNLPGFVNDEDSNDSQLWIEIAGATPGTQHDQVIVEGAVTLGGSLRIEFIDGFIPRPGERFEILTYASVSGAFSQVEVVGLSDLMDVDVLVGAGSLMLETFFVSTPVGSILSAPKTIWSAMGGPSAFSTTRPSWLAAPS